MKVVYSFLYVLTFILYLYLGSYSKLSGGAHIISQLLFIVILINFVKDYKVNSKLDILFFNYVTGLTFSRITLTLICIFAPKEWTDFVTNIYAHLVSGSFICFLAFAYYEHRKL